MFDKKKVPMYKVEYISLLDCNGETLYTAPMNNPIEIPISQKIVGMKTDLRVDVKIELRGS